MRIESKKLIDDFCKEIKKDYPNLSIESIAEIARSPFIFVKKIMALGKFARIRLQYLGVFKVYRGKALESLRKLDVARATMSEERFNEFEKNIKEYIKIIDNESKEDNEED